MPEDGTEPLAQESSNAASETKRKGHELTISDLLHQLSKTSTRTDSPGLFSPHMIHQFLNTVACDMKDRVDNDHVFLESVTPRALWYPTAANQMQHTLTAYCQSCNGNHCFAELEHRSTQQLIWHCYKCSCLGHLSHWKEYSTKVNSKIKVLFWQKHKWENLKFTLTAIPHTPLGI